MLPGTIYRRNVAGRLGCLSLYIVTCISLTQGCSMPGQEIDELTLVEGVDIILYGKVLNRIDNPAYAQYGWPRAYDARMEVYCTLKGKALPQFVNISEAGFVGGQCADKRLDVGKEYIVLLYEMDDKRLVPSDELPRESTDEDLQRLLSACDLIRTPIIGSSSIHARCPAVASETDCVRPPTYEPGLDGCEDNDGIIYAEGESWPHDLDGCFGQCTCKNGVIECHRSCPPTGLVPPPSPDCPSPRYAHTGKCCPGLVCYDVETTATGTTMKRTTLTTATESMPTYKVEGKTATTPKDKDESDPKTGQTGEVVSDGDSSAIVTSSILLILSLQLFVATLSI